LHFINQSFRLEKQSDQWDSLIAELAKPPKKISEVKLAFPKKGENELKREAKDHIEKTLQTMILKTDELHRVAKQIEDFHESAEKLSDEVVIQIQADLFKAYNGLKDAKSLIKSVTKPS